MPKDYWFVERLRLKKNNKDYSERVSGAVLSICVKLYYCLHYSISQAKDF